jgi:aarF domain-containing kinase
VARAIELREIVTSLGPAYIKLGQALSIRPDILSPAAMTELQKLCDKVPSFPDDIAMDLIKEELGPWQEIYSELSPSPIAAGNTHFILMFMGIFMHAPAIPHNVVQFFSKLGCCA